MTTQNVLLYRTTFTNLTPGAPTTYYYPTSAGVIADGYDHLTFRLQLVSADVNNTLTATIWADDGTGSWLWNESLGLYDWMTGAWGTASWVANNATTLARLQAWNHNAKVWRVQLVVLLAAAAANSGVIEIRGVKE